MEGFLLQINYLIGASSIGTSINPQFIASFASAAGKRPHQDFDSQESDPEVIQLFPVAYCILANYWNILYFLDEHGHLRVP
jgi:hypothetical protein